MIRDVSMQVYCMNTTTLSTRIRTDYVCVCSTSGAVEPVFQLLQPLLQLAIGCEWASCRFVLHALALLQASNITTAPLSCPPHLLPPLPRPPALCMNARVPIVRALWLACVPAFSTEVCMQRARACSLRACCMLVCLHAAMHHQHH